MSKHIAEVVSFSLSKHPNADSLSLAQVRGWSCIVKTEDFLHEKLGVYIPIDMIAPADHPLLGFLDGKRIKTIKLRGCISQGLLIPLGKLVELYGLDQYQVKEGDDLTELLGITRWVPKTAPAKLMGGHVDLHEEVERHEWLAKFTDIENWNNYPDVIKEGEEVVISLKMHGTNSCYALIDGKFYICSRNRVLRIGKKVLYLPRNKTGKFNKLIERMHLQRIFYKKKVLPPMDTIWHRVAEQYQMEKKLRALASKFNLKRVALYGEIVNCQKGFNYGLKDGECAFYAFDMRVDSNLSSYIGEPLLKTLLGSLGVQRCPILYEGKFNTDLLELRRGADPVGITHIREGIVIKPVEYRTDASLGRVILKRVSEDYLLSKYAA